MTNFFLTGTESGGTTVVYIILGVIVMAMFIFPMFTNKKRQQNYSSMLNAIAAGDKVKTVGGVIGTVIEVRSTSPVDKEIVIVTGEGANASTMVFDINAVYQILSKVKRPQDEQAYLDEMPEAAAKAEEVQDKDEEAANEEPQVLSE